MFDPMADIIDLRDVLDVFDSTDMDDDEHVEAREFLLAAMGDLGYPATIQAATEYAESESTVIARRHWVKWVEEFAEDIGATPRASDGGMPPWPIYCIDWERAAEELETDYSTFTYDGREYLIRSV